MASLRPHPQVSPQAGVPKKLGVCCSRCGFWCVFACVSVCLFTSRMRVGQAWGAVRECKARGLRWRWDRILVAELRQLATEASLRPWILPRISRLVLV